MPILKQNWFIVVSIMPIRLPVKSTLLYLVAHENYKHKNVRLNLVMKNYKLKNWPH